MKTRVLLIIGPEEEAIRAGVVALQIAHQHHAEAPQLVCRHIKPDPEALYQVVCRDPRARKNLRRAPHRIINLKEFPYPRGRALTFALREAVDFILAPQPK